MEVHHDFETLTGDVISRTLFGSNFEEGKKIFELMKELTVLTIQVIQSVYIPGWRYLFFLFNILIIFFQLFDWLLDIRVCLISFLYNEEKSRFFIFGGLIFLFGIFFSGLCPPRGTTGLRKLTKM